jgi:hypothetical protein
MARLLLAVLSAALLFVGASAQFQYVLPYALVFFAVLMCMLDSLNRCLVASSSSKDNSHKMYLAIRIGIRRTMAMVGCNSTTFSYSMVHYSPLNLANIDCIARCDRYLCPDTLACVHFPHHCPCPHPVFEEKFEIGEGRAICISKGGFKAGEAARKVELARKGLI